MQNKFLCDIFYLEKIMKRRYKKVTINLAGILLILVIIVLNNLGYIELKKENLKNVEKESSNKKLYLVKRVVDGDTFVVNFDGTDEKVRLIGVDTPESVHKDKSKNTKEGKIASNYTTEKIQNKQVELEFDVQQRDKYGRILAYVYIDGNMLNKMLLEDGMAKLATYPPNVKYVEDFKKLQAEARKNNVGFWNGIYSK